MRLSGVDLNLLVSLQALLQEVSVTRAAERLYVSQPTMSQALSRLRRHFGDELLARVGNSYELTPLAANLLPQVESALKEVRHIFGTDPDFDPTTTQREFRIGASDHGVAVVGHELAIAVDGSGDGVRIRFAPLTQTAIEDPAEFLRHHDALLLPHGEGMALPHLDLFKDRWVCIADRNNRHVQGELTLEAMAAASWITTYQHIERATQAMRLLRLHGIEPHVLLNSESFLALPGLVAGTDCLALVQSRVLRAIGVPPGVVVHELPFEAPRINLALWWGQAAEHDPGHAWLRGKIAETVYEFEATDPAPTTPGRLGHGLAHI